MCAVDGDGDTLIMGEVAFGKEHRSDDFEIGGLAVLTGTLTLATLLATGGP